MGEIYFASDHHFFHTNILGFTDAEGKLIRGARFSSVEEMNETMVDNHNRTVRQHDKVYFLGDIGFNRNGLDKLLPRMHGKKRLILGNHDHFKGSFYDHHFDKVMVSWRGVRGDVLFSHYPTVLDGERVKANVHGHVHTNTLSDPRYMNISMEVIDYTPLHIDTIFDELKNRGIIE